MTENAKKSDWERSNEKNRTGKNWRAMVQNHGQDIAERICRQGRKPKTVEKKSGVKRRERCGSLNKRGNEV